MKTIKLYELVSEGKKPIIKFNDNVYEWIEESVDPMMMGKIIGASIEYNEIKFLLDLNPFESYNRSVARHDWRDDEGHSVLSWFDTSFYPKNGIAAIYLPISEETEIAFDFIEEDSLLNEYAKVPQEISYVEWLENEVKQLRSK
ncbi:hypothetical protein CHCC14809_2318 [Bacillus licheniformis]|uniref:Uncharacterized protein n=1 Tax=Bacillus paralicheniformis TaxID=1648923 RepID=A0ABY3FZD6_9BACI|nr:MULTISPECIES: hypothetical protein [Bacillus subtilis group]KND05561.1 hypothetical protein ACJ43_20615 [Bacillus paralicheniformis]MBM6849458.1 hypothetical protein [Bacillus licheniformis]MED1237907.1 hypothetical protein [Bacillus paralicheniformis]OJT64869.1 hypothetical protein BFP49_06245 [Bacillus licheniformis]TWL41698.1 hypothetical protein CHCC15381_3867 [Bacillus paralicheniformis]